jgi:hypothetical protein
MRADNYHRDVRDSPEELEGARQIETFTQLLAKDVWITRLKETPRPILVIKVAIVRPIGTLAERQVHDMVYGSLIHQKPCSHFF